MDASSEVSVHIYLSVNEKNVEAEGKTIRAPVDRTTLQPGRRVSKAGLESLRPFLITSTDASSSAAPNNGDNIDSERQVNNGSEARPSPRASPGMGMGGHAMTPAGDGPLKWI